MRTAPVGSHVWMFGSFLVELFGKDEGVWPCWEVWTCWRRSITRGGLWGFKSPCQAQSLSTHNVQIRCKLSATAPVPPSSPPWWSWTNPLKLWARPQLNASYAAMVFHHRNRTVTKTKSQSSLNGNEISTPAQSLHLFIWDCLHNVWQKGDPSQHQAASDMPAPFPFYPSARDWLTFFFETGSHYVALVGLQLTM